MKRTIFSALSLMIGVFMFVSCDQTYDDLMTADVKTGGIVVPTGSIPYKLGSTPKVDITIDILKGPGIEAIEVYRTYTDKARVLDQTINIGSANTSGDVEKKISYTYSQLTAGLGMPADEGTLEIGDKWTISYVSVMADDGRKVDNASTTTVAVANFFAGPYEKDMKYFHPTAGGSYPTTPYSAYTENVDLVAENAYECDDWFGVWEDNKLTINIDPANNYKLTLTFERSDAVAGDPNNPANVPSYDPVTGIIKLYYYYPGSGGNRIFWAVYTPR